MKQFPAECPPLAILIQNFEAVIGVQSFAHHARNVHLIGSLRMIFKKVIISHEMFAFQRLFFAFEPMNPQEIAIPVAAVRMITPKTGFSHILNIDEIGAHDML